MWGDMKRTRRGRGHSVLATWLMLAWCLPAGMVAGSGNLAAQPLRGESVLERKRPDYDPRGARIGGFVFLPSLTASEVYDSNIFRSQANKVHDFITVLSPELELRSDWNNHELNFVAATDIGLHANNSAENYIDYRFGANGRLDISRDSNLFGGITYSRLHEDRGSPDDVFGEHPTVFNALYPRIGYFHRFNRLSVRADVSALRLDYHDVRRARGFGEINNDDRDRVHGLASLKVAYQIQKQYEAFIRGTYHVVRYDSTPDDNGFNRNSHGWEIVGGVSLDFTGVLTGDFFAGYRKQYMNADPRLKDVDGPTFGAALTWNPSGLTTVQAGIERSVQQSTLFGASGFFATVYRASVDHELRRWLIVSGYGQLRHDVYFGNGRNDNIYGSGIGVKYLMNRYAQLGLKYDFTRRTSNIANQGFTVHAVTLTVRAQF